MGKEKRVRQLHIIVELKEIFLLRFWLESRETHVNNVENMEYCETIKVLHDNFIRRRRQGSKKFSPRWGEMKNLWLVMQSSVYLPVRKRGRTLQHIWLSTGDCIIFLHSTRDVHRAGGSEANFKLGQFCSCTRCLMAKFKNFFMDFSSRRRGKTFTTGAKIDYRVVCTCFDESALFHRWPRSRPVSP